MEIVKFVNSIQFHQKTNCHAKNNASTPKQFQKKENVNLVQNLKYHPQINKLALKKYAMEMKKFLKMVLVKNAQTFKYKLQINKVAKKNHVKKNKQYKETDHV